MITKFLILCILSLYSIACVSNANCANKYKENISQLVAKADIKALEKSISGRNKEKILNQNVELFGTTLLHIGVIESQYKSVAWLIKNGIDVNILDKSKSPAISVAIRMHNIDMIKILLASEKINFNLRNTVHLNPLDYMILSNNDKVIELILAHKPDCLNLISATLRSQYTRLKDDNKKLIKDYIDSDCSIDAPE